MVNYQCIVGEKDFGGVLEGHPVSVINYQKSWIPPLKPETSNQWLQLQHNNSFLLNKIIINNNNESDV